MQFTSGKATVKLKGGESKLIEGLPTGVEYTVTEASADGFQVTGKTGDEGTISTTLSKAEFTNTRETGDLEVKKSVTSSTPNDKNKDFSFTVTLSDTTINGTYGEMTFKNGVANFTLKHDETKKAEGLPTGISYTVEEAVDGKFITTKTGETGTIATGTVTANYSNAKDEGGLQVSKTVKP